MVLRPGVCDAKILHTTLPCALPMNTISLLLTTAVAAAVRPELQLTFSGTMYANRSAYGSLHMETVGFVAAKASLNATAQPSELPDGRNVSVVSMFGADAGVRAIQPFFNYSTCYLSPVQFIGGASDWHPMTFEESVEDMMGMIIYPYYAMSTKAGHARFAGVDCDVYTYDSAAGGEILNYSFCVTPTGALLSANYSAVEGDIFEVRALARGARSSSLSRRTKSPPPSLP